MTNARVAAAYAGCDSRDGAGGEPADLMILAWVVVAFADEAVRRAVPGYPVAVTAFKDGLLMLAAAGLATRTRPLARYVFLWLPWSLYTLISASVVLVSPYGTVTAFFACLRTYSLAPAFLVVGYHLAVSERTRAAFSRIFIGGCVCAIVVGLLQETARESLPGILAARYYKEKHTLSGGLYAESLYFSPQIFGQVMVFLVAWLYFSLRFRRPGTSSLSRVALLFFSMLALLVCRIRTALLMALAVIAMEWVLLRRSSVRSSWGYLLGAAVTGALVLVPLALFVMAPAEKTHVYVGKTTDWTYYSRVARPEELALRARTPLQELRGLSEDKLAFGHGAGTSGAIRRFLMPCGELACINEARNTGLFLVVNETGVLGFAFFALFYGGMLATAGLRVWNSGRAAPLSVPAFALAVAYTLWFVMKSHSCIENGLSHTLWLGSLGFCFGALEERAGTDSAGPVDGVLAPTEPVGDQVVQGQRMV